MSGLSSRIHEKMEEIACEHAVNGLALLLDSNSNTTSNNSMHIVLLLFSKVLRGHHSLSTCLRLERSFYVSEHDFSLPSLILKKLSILPFFTTSMNSNTTDICMHLHLGIAHMYPPICTQLCGTRVTFLDAYIFLGIHLYTVHTTRYIYCKLLPYLSHRFLRLTN